MKKEEIKRIQKLKLFTMKPSIFARETVRDIEHYLAFGDTLYGVKPKGEHKKMLEKDRDRILTEIMVDALPDQ